MEEPLPYSMEDYVLVHRVLGSSQEGSEVLRALAPQDLQRLPGGVSRWGRPPSPRLRCRGAHPPRPRFRRSPPAPCRLGGLHARALPERLLTARALSGLQSVAEQIRERECSLKRLAPSC